MYKVSPWIRVQRYLLGLGLLAALVAIGLSLGLGEAADHRDGPIFGPPGTTSANGRPDVNDIYLFQSPANASNTVIVMDVSPFSGVLTPITFDQTVFFDLKVDN